MFKDTKKYFPIYKKNPKLVFLDTAASALKPLSVIESINECYAYEYSNVHRGLYKLSSNLTKRFEDVRNDTSKYISAESNENIIFTKSATEAINLVVNSFGEKFLSNNDEVIISYLEHHSNIVPWHIASKKIGFKVVPVNVTEYGNVDMEDLEKKINHNTKIISLSHMSNITGSILDTQRVKDLAKKYNIPFMLDGCQHIAHAPVSMKDLECDFYVFSGHKLYGPSGVGVLYMKSKWFELLGPYQGGGAMIDKVEIDETSFANGFQKFEAGTPPIVQVIGLGSSYEFVSKFGLKNIFEHEKELYQYAYEKIQAFNDVRVIGHSDNKGGILSFVIENIHPNDIGMILDQYNIAIRTGHHCAQPLLKRYGLSSTARLSLGVYNDKNDIDMFIEAIKKTKSFFKV